MSNNATRKYETNRELGFGGEDEGNGELERDITNSTNKARGSYDWLLRDEHP